MGGEFDYPLTVLEMMTAEFQNSFGIYALLAAFFFGFILSFAVGANDSANSWATPVGAGTVSLGVAFFLGSICEIVGSVFLSGEVIKSISGEASIVAMGQYKSNFSVEIEMYKNHENVVLLREKTLVLGIITSMVASQLWQLIATYFGWPVSGTHTIISALLGFTLVEEGPAGVNIGYAGIQFDQSENAESIIKKKPDGIFKVLYGLLISPMLALFMGFGLYYFVYKTAVTSKNLTGWSSRVAYSSCVFLILMSMVFFFVTSYSNTPAGWKRETFGGLLGLGIGLGGAVLFMFAILPVLFRMTGDFKLSFGMCFKSSKPGPGESDEFCDKVANSVQEGNTFEGNNEEIALQKHVIDIGETLQNENNLEENESTEGNTEDFVDEAPIVKRVFRPLQVLAACYGALNHGANDVANCIGPLVSVWLIFKSPINYNADSKLYGVLLWGGLGIALGLVCFGRRVIETMGCNMTRMTPSLGFTVVTTASIVIMLCSILGIPASTTHCQVLGLVGAGVAKGWVDSGSFKGGLKTVDLKLMGNIALSWVVTIPFSLVLSALCYAIVRTIVFGSCC